MVNARSSESIQDTKLPICQTSLPEVTALKAKVNMKPVHSASY